MEEPRDQSPATPGRHLRASHADREQVIGTLKAAFVQGRLAKDEFDLRVTQTLASRTYGELAALTVDLPAGLTAAEPSEPVLAPGGRSILWRPGLLITAETVLYAALWPVAATLPTNSEGDPMDGVSLLAPATLIYLLILISTVVWKQVLASRQENPSRGQLPRRPAPGGDGDQARMHLTATDPGGRVPSANPHRRHIAEAARRRLPPLALPVRRPRADGALAPGTTPACG
jgi:hypothetical protein